MTTALRAHPPRNRFEGEDMSTRLKETIDRRDADGRLNIDQMKDSMRAPWIAGDCGAIAREIGAPEAERFVARMGLEPGARVLDIACGTGNVTIPLYQGS